MLRALNQLIRTLLTLALLAPLAVAGLLAVVHHEGWFEAKPPDAWRTNAQPRDILFVPDHDVVYWGRPDAQYSRYATRRKRAPIAIVVHHTLPKPPAGLIAYGHKVDPLRGNASFGYHFYIARNGNILQGAPLSRRTNHVKYSTNSARRRRARYVWSGNSIGVALVGACKLAKKPSDGGLLKCAAEAPTKAQLDAGLAVIHALEARFGIACKAVFGHGELQRDRETFEGEKLSGMARAACVEPQPPLSAATAKSTAASEGPSGG